MENDERLIDCCKKLVKADLFSEENLIKLDEALGSMNDAEKFAMSTMFLDSVLDYVFALEEGMDSLRGSLKKGGLTNGIS